MLKSIRRVIKHMMMTEPVGKSNLRFLSNMRLTVKAHTSKPSIYLILEYLPPSKVC